MRGSFLGAIFITALSIMLLLLGILSLLGVFWQVPFAIVLFLTLYLILFIWSDFKRVKEKSIINYLHHCFPELEYSLGLFVEENLLIVAKIQKERMVGKLPPVKRIPLPEQWKSLSLLLFASIVVFYVGFNSNLQEVGESNPATDNSVTNDELKLPKVDTLYTTKGDVFVTVIPPAYTGKPQFSWQDGELVPEGSVVQFAVSEGDMEPRLILQGTDTLNFLENKRKNNSWLLNRKINYSQAFQLQFLSSDSSITEPISVIEILNDQKPVIQFNLTETRVELNWTDLQNKLAVPLEMRDDYGLSAANVVATLSKGDGESVKFREMKWPLPGFKKGKKVQSFTYNLKIDTLGLDPGDELYFFIEVMDNKQPDYQRTKSEVFFIEVKDTVQQESVAFEGLALSTEPEYFKSQRQIIIDTEKLLKERRSISRSEFEQRSNTIGADQKILRLRYGIFLGEEYEVSGGLGEMAHGNDDEDHDHDHEEHEDEGHDPHDPNIDHSGHDHSNEAIGSQPGETKFSNSLYNSPEMEAYVHAHDDSEIATFFDAEVKAKLKEALSNMWDAELYLRTYEPKKAIPYEYKALELIKEVQRASRIYVERMGFEPPPLEPDKKRLSGKLDKIQAEAISFNAETNEFLLNIQALLTEMKAISYTDLKEEKIKAVKDLSKLLVKQMVNSPVRYAKILAAISTFREEPSHENFQKIIGLAETVLPENLNKIVPESSGGLRLQEVFHRQLNNE